MSLEDRLLDHALERAFRDEDPPDLAARIAEAWARGERGSLVPDELEAIEREFPGPRLYRGRRPGEPRRGRSRLLWPLVAAAAAVLLSLGAWFLALERGVESPLEVAEPTTWFARADAEVRALRGPARAEVRTLELVRGDALLVDRTPASLSFASGASLGAQAPSLFVVDEASEGPLLRLVLGDLALRAGARGTRVSVGFADVELEPDSAMTIELSVGPSDEPRELDVAYARTVLLAELDELRILRVRVTAGAAVLRSRDSERRLTAIDGSFSVPSRSAPVVADADFERFEDLSSSFFELARGPVFFGMPPSGFGSAMAQLAGLLAEEPQLRVEFRRLLVDVLDRDEGPAMFTSYALDLLAAAPDPESLELARRIWSETPQRFISRHLVAFAEMGGFEFDTELRALVELHAEDPLAVSELPFLPAVYLALRGDALGAALLEEVASVPKNARELQGVLMNALATFALGELRNDDSFERALDELGPRLERVAVSYPEDAVLELLAYELVGQLRAEAGTPRVGDLLERWARFRDAERRSGLTPRAIRERVAELRER